MDQRLDLHAGVEATTPEDRLLEAALVPAQDHRSGGRAAFDKLYAEHPEAARANIWVAAATGERDAVRGFLAADAGLATQCGGTRRWEPLLYLCFSRLLRLDAERAARMREIAGALLDAGADPNCSWSDASEVHDNRETPIYGAAGVANDIDLARLLVERGADPNDGETSYHMVEHDGVPCADFIVPKLEPKHRGAALGHKLDYEDLAGVRKLLELGVDPNGPTPFANWPIHQAVWRSRSKPFFDLLFEFGADVNKPNGHGRTAYAMAARTGKREIQKWLVEAGAKTDLQPADAFLAACAGGDAGAARQVLAANPGLWDALDERDRGEICETAAAGNLDGVRTMLAVGWDVNTRGVVWQETPAHRAALEGHLPLFEFLVESGADLTLRDRSYQSSPLGWAQHVGKPEVIEAIRKHPGRLDIWDAIELDLTDRALELIPQVDPNLEMCGCTPGVLLRLAAMHGNVEVVHALLERGADPALRSGQGMTPLEIALEAKHGEIAALLQRH